MPVIWSSVIKVLVLLTGESVEKKNDQDVIVPSTVITVVFISFVFHRRE